MLVDTHCHVDHYPNPFDVLKKARNRDIFIIAVTNLPSHFQQGTEHLEGQRNVRHALGMHPLMVSEHTGEFGLFEQLVKKTSWIGEIGADGSREKKGSLKEQLASLKRTLEIAGVDKIFSLHSRRAEADVLSVLQEFGVRKGIFHWYTGSKKVLREILESGFYLSVNPAMCISSAGRAIISEIPTSRLLTESDGPFASSGKMPYYPWDVVRVIEYLASERSMTSEEVTETIWNNFKRLC